MNPSTRNYSADTDEWPLAPDAGSELTTAKATLEASADATPDECFARDLIVGSFDHLDES